MKTFMEFMQGQQINEKEVDMIYNKTHIAVELARMYAPELMQNIATIANLASGAYGVYNSGENSKVLPQPIEQSLIYYGKLNRKNINNIPKLTIRKYYPNIPENQIKSSDTIRINVKRIVNEFPDDVSRILEIASTIIHEATHEYERENYGSTSEAGPVRRETDFMNWIKRGGKQQLDSLLKKYSIQQNTSVMPQLHPAL